MLVDVPLRAPWARLELSGLEAIAAVRLSAPVATAWHRAGHEPLDYDVLLKTGKTTRSLVSVRDGAHLKRELGEDGRTQWITVEFPGFPEASEVEIHCHKVSGSALAPVLFEVEVLAAR